jgi:hypothetical protein
MVSFLQRVTLEKPQSNQRASAPPFGASPRLGMPSLRHCSGGGYRGIPAAVPPAQRLRSASGKRAADQDQDQKPKQRQRQDQQLREQARSHRDDVHLQETGRLSGRNRRQASSHNGAAYHGAFSPLYRPSVSSPAAFDLDAPPPREAEWRFCAVGNPAWMPG